MAGNFCCKTDKKTIKDSLKSREIAEVYDLSNTWGEKQKREQDKI